MLQNSMATFSFFVW